MKAIARAMLKIDEYLKADGIEYSYFLNEEEIEEVEDLIKKLKEKRDEEGVEEIEHEAES